MNAVVRPARNHISGNVDRFEIGLLASPEVVQKRVTLYRLLPVLDEVLAPSCLLRTPGRHELSIRDAAVEGELAIRIGQAIVRLDCREMRRMHRSRLPLGPAEIGHSRHTDLLS